VLILNGGLIIGFCVGVWWEGEISVSMVGLGIYFWFAPGDYFYQFVSVICKKNMDHSMAF